MIFAHHLDPNAIPLPDYPSGTASVYHVPVDPTAFGCCHLARRFYIGCTCSHVTYCPTHGVKHHGTHD